jgi:hypothetical protein
VQITIVDAPRWQGGASWRRWQQDDCEWHADCSGKDGCSNLMK